MKKFILLLMFILFAMCFSINAEASDLIPVRVSDLGAERFVKQCNYYISLERSERITLDGLIKSDDKFDYWGGGVVGGGVIILFSVNKDGYVHEVEIFSEKNSAPLNLGGSVLAACLGTIGLTNNEVTRLFNQNNKYLNIWGSKIKRNILVYTEDKYNKKSTRIMAFI